jgi:hypothetical protein
VSPLSILAPQYEMTRHGHRRLARLGQAINAGFSGRTVKDNYLSNKQLHDVKWCYLPSTSTCGFC